MVNTTLTESERMAGGRRKENFDRERLELVADPKLIARASRQAERLGLSLSAYVRQAITRQVERDEADAPPPRKAKDGGKP
jgi:hypothetical protein